MIQVLPVIPEDEVVCNCVDDWPRERGVSNDRVYDSHDLVRYDSSRFGYVAILRDDTVLLEVGRPLASLQLSAMSIDDYVESNPECNNINVLDATIYGLLQPAAVPGWQTFCLNINSESPQSQWKGLRFHVYDDTVVRVKNDITIWTFCLVHRCMENEYAQQYQEWMVRNLIQFTELFRKNDVVWQTGSTLSCQFLFAPVIEQRMHTNHTVISNRQVRTPTYNDDVCWSVMAENIIDRNHCIAKAAKEGFCREKEFARSSPPSQGPSFVSDESDCEDSCSNSSIGNNGEHDFGASECDDESTTASDTFLSPERVGVLPFCYRNSDDENDYLEHLAAFNSIWKTVEQSRKCDDFPLITNRFVVLSISAKADKSLLSAPPVPKPLAPDNSSPEDASNGSLDSDEERIPLICLVGNQVDDQHSDLWKRSPKCISKAVALGLSPRRQKPTPSPTSSCRPLAKQNSPVNEIETLLSPVEILASAIAETFGKFWKHVSCLPGSQSNVSTIDNVATTHEDEGCWRPAFLKPKQSALL
jgi:hypothetical protein